MIAEQIREFAERVKSTANPIGVIVAEAEALAVAAADLERQAAENVSKMIAEREQELAERDATIAGLRAQLAAH